ncbi:HDOD domain-containing protein [Methylobacillus flagellatus]|uniref:histidine kinase n=1 Tax=Methylobacillus flagellatus (strain ATCC 51484 / DSM 6875 / VKM B-1610 / KT) TaxID=265072 RepID=Q1H235_METFK|nr:HDOD domain-containing protein [Methylobacillus flagellatus]ABE49452.1 histidine kinase [Methylobacillus flagellatus KT]
MCSAAGAQIVLNNATISALPSVPQVLTKLLETLQDENSGLEQLANLVEMDVVISARVLEIANSAAYRRNHHPVLSIRSGIVILGWDMVKMLTLSIICQRMFNDYYEQSNQDIEHYWYHSLRCAVIAKSLATHTETASPDEAYVAGLLHNIGRLGLLAGFKHKYPPFFAIDDSLPGYLESEVAHFGIDHCELGAWIIRNWNIKSFLEDAVAYHHLSVTQLEHTPALVKIVYLANLLLIERRPERQSALIVAKKWFQLDSDVINELMSLGISQVHILSDSLGINVGAAHTSQHDWDRQEPDIEALVEALSKNFSSPPATSPPFSKNKLVKGVMDTALINHLESTCLQVGQQDGFFELLSKLSRLLCNAREVLLFVPDEARQHLSGKPIAEDQGWIESFQFPIKPSTSIITAAWIKKSYCHSFQAFDGFKPSLPDQQIMRLCGVEGMLCFPMFAKDTLVGVMVFALNQAEFLIAKQQLNVQAALARIVASRLLPDQKPADPELEAAVHEERLKRFVHETSTPLSTIKNYLAILEQKMLLNGIPNRDIAIVNEEIDRVGSLIGNLYSGEQEHIAASTDINQLIQDLLALHRQTYLQPAGIKVTLNLYPNLPKITTIPYQVRQVLVNLIRNAAEAMPEGGELSISTFLENQSGSGQGILIQISDTGPGIPESVLSKLFTPVESTKGGEHGGIGLSISHDLVKGLCGSIACRTSSTGTTFDIRLPIQANPHSKLIN